MTSPASYQGLALARCHDFNPKWARSLPLTLQVLKGSDVVHLDILLRATELAGVGQEAPFEIRTRTADA